MSSELIYKPYVYILKFKQTTQFYIGVKYGKNANPELFWVKYFTSSKTIKNLVKLYGKDAFDYRILKTFTTAEKALKYEQTIIRRMNLINDDRFFNMASNNPSPIASGYIYITNGEENKMWNKHVDVPEGYRRGVKMREFQSVLGSKWINDGKNEFMIKGDIPIGFSEGRITSPIKGRFACYDPVTLELRYYNEDDIPSNYNIGMPVNHNKNNVWLHNKNTHKEIHIKPDSPKVIDLLSDGYEYGRLETSLTKFQLAGAASKGVKCKIWVNNGEINTVVFEDQIPEGFTKGVLDGSRSVKKPRNELTCPHCNYTGKGESNMYRWHFDNCKNNPNNTTIKVKKIAYHDIETGKRVYLPEGTPPTDNLVRGY